MKLAATLALLLFVAAACGSDSKAELSGPALGDYPESLAFTTGLNGGAEVDTGAAPAPMSDGGEAGTSGGSDAPMATFDEVRGVDDPADGAEVSDDMMTDDDEFGANAGSDATACAAMRSLASRSMTDAAAIAAAFDEIAELFPSPVLGPLEAAIMGDAGAAADLFLDPDGVIDRLRLDAETYADCGVPLFAATLGEAGPTTGEGDCFSPSVLDVSAKAAVGAELNEDVYVFARVDCSS